MLRYKKIEKGYNELVDKTNKFYINYIKYVDINMRILLFAVRRR